MKLLPKWIMQDTQPAIYDAESVTNLEAIAKLRAAMNELITQFNAFVEEVNAKVDNFIAETTQDQEVFETALRQEFQDFIDLVELKLETATGGGVSARIANVNLPASGWEGAASPYSQVVTIPGVTVNSQVDLTPSVEQLSIFHEKDLAFVAENENGTVTVYAVGQKPENSYTIQVTITEVSV